MAIPKTALLVVDMQIFFAEMTRQALPNIKRLISHFQSTKAPVIFTQHGHSKEELITVPSPSMLVRRWGPEGSIASGSADWELQDEMKKFFGEGGEEAGGSPKVESQGGSDGWPKLVHKNTYDAFINTNLVQILQEAGVKRVVVCGVMTDFCCDTSARSAFNRGYETLLVGDACGSANKTQHQEGLRAFEKAYGEIVSTEEVLRRLS